MYDRGVKRVQWTFPTVYQPINFLVPGTPRLKECRLYQMKLCGGLQLQVSKPVAEVMKRAELKNTDSRFHLISQGQLYITGGKTTEK